MAPIILSRGFSVKTLKGVWLCHRSQIGVSLSQKTESPDCYITTMQAFFEEGGLLD